MEQRRFGRSGHLSTVAIFGAAAFSRATQEQADAAMERVLAAGVNHIDVAPSYGDAELRLGPWLEKTRGKFFLGCKTQERTKEGAAAELRRSLERLRVNSFDLYQLHAITTFEELDRVTARGGALEAMIEARAQGLTRFIGITGHGILAPAIYREALRRFDFDSVLFPINFVLYANPAYRREADALVRECRARNVGTLIIKANCARPWGERARTHTTWYEPFSEPAKIQRAVNFALSQDITGVCSSGDLTILPHFLAACENFSRQDAPAQEEMLASATQYEPLFA